MTQSNEGIHNNGHISKPRIMIGDIVRIAGYGHYTFEVYAVHADYYRDAETEYIDVYYDCYCEQDGQYYYAEDVDITLYKRPKHVNLRRLSDKQAEVEDKLNNAVLGELVSVFDVRVDDGVVAEKKVDNKYEQIDELLEELYDVNVLIKTFGKHEDDERKDRRYELRKAEIEAKLIELMGGK